MTRREEYEVYLRSEHWRNLRKQAREVHGNHCAACNARPIQFHHLRYGKWYDVTTDDLVPLCDRCHSLAHSNGQAAALIYGQQASSEKRVVLLAIIGERPCVRRKKKHKGKKQNRPFSRIARLKISKQMRVHLKILQRVDRHKRQLDRPDLSAKLRAHHMGMLMHWEKKLREFQKAKSFARD